MAIPIFDVFEFILSKECPILLLCVYTRWSTFNS